jgi:hypothetical protein
MKKMVQGNSEVQKGLRKEGVKDEVWINVKCVFSVE